MKQFDQQSYQESKINNTSIKQTSVPVKIRKLGNRTHSLEGCSSTQRAKNSILPLGKNKKGVSYFIYCQDRDKTITSPNCSLMFDRETNVMVAFLLQTHVLLCCCCLT